jgi:hypothetical protein
MEEARRYQVKRSGVGWVKRHGMRRVGQDGRDIVAIYSTRPAFVGIE